jgi:hypothetical protein
VERSLRQMLVESDVAAVAIAVLLWWFLQGLLTALWLPIFRIAKFVFTAIAILDIPYFDPALNARDRFEMIKSATCLYGAMSSVLAAWLLARWVYGTGPIDCLAYIRRKKMGNSNA